MFSDSGDFLWRAKVLEAALKSQAFPSAHWLAGQAGCSRSTAQRTIERLKYDYGVPIEYDQSRRGWYLTEADYVFGALPPGKDELTALLLLRRLANIIDAPDLREKIDLLWTQYSAQNPKLVHELESLTRYFSSDSTEIGVLTDTGVLDYVNAACKGEPLELVYKSPWRHKEEKVYQGRIERVHFSDGNLYLHFLETSGVERILNASFVRRFTILPGALTFLPRDPALCKCPNWLEGFGVWSGANLEEIEIRILPPAAQYFAAQRWHEDQEDGWDGEVLVRRLPAVVSPELMRRVLSLGAFVECVKPPALAEMVRREASEIVARLAETVGGEL